MKKPADSLILAALNLLVVGGGILIDFLHFRIPFGFAALPLVVALLLLTLIFALRDLIRRKDRSQIFVALGLTTLIIYLFFLRRW